LRLDAGAAPPEPGGPAGGGPFAYSHKWRFLMIRTLAVLVLGVAVCFSLNKATAAEEGKEVTLEGKILCGKCELKESEKCATAIVVEKDGKKTTYWFDMTSSKKYHKDICQEVKEGTVKGTVKKDGEKMVVTVSDLKYK
jgi:RecG-like helicase